MLFECTAEEFSEFVTPDFKPDGEGDIRYFRSTTYEGFGAVCIDGISQFFNIPEEMGEEDILMAISSISGRFRRTGFNVDDVVEEGVVEEDVSPYLPTGISTVILSLVVFACIITILYKVVM